MNIMIILLLSHLGHTIVKKSIINIKILKKEKCHLFLNIQKKILQTTNKIENNCIVNYFRQQNINIK